MFFIGKQDIEDSISSLVWLDVINDVTKNKLTIVEEDIEKIKRGIPNNYKINSRQKFYVLLQKMVRIKMQELLKANDEPITYDILPSKGSEQAEILLKYINNISQLDINLINAFKKLNSE